MINLPEEYIVQKFFQYGGRAKHNKYNNTYQASCPSCREGSSWLKKKRLYFIPKNNRIFCHNCGLSNTPLQWIKEVCGLSFKEIQSESQNFDLLPSTFNEENKQNVIEEMPTLPLDCINLHDPTQVAYYKNNKVVKSVINFLKSRRLDTAINIPNAFYLSLTDYNHKNRLVIPFFDINGKIVHYQTRSILNDDLKPRYISKLNSEKTLFNIDKVTNKLNKMFILEGPLNSCFIQNGVAVAGIQENSTILFSQKQQDQIIAFPFHEKIWILDSQWIDKASKNKSEILADLGENLFIWPKNIGIKYKDFNEVCVGLKIDKIDPKFVIANTYKGLAAKIKLKQVNT